MKTNVQPGMLARVVALSDRPMNTPEILGRIVYVERGMGVNDEFKATCGTILRNARLYEDLTWVISAKTPLPVQLVCEDGSKKYYETYERPMMDKCLRPLLDPNLDISDQEVRELFSTYPLPGELSVKDAFARWCDFVHNR